jgi:hypothetical protein
MEKVDNFLFLPNRKISKQCRLFPILVGRKLPTFSVFRIGRKYRLKSTFSESEENLYILHILFRFSTCGVKGKNSRGRRKPPDILFTILDKIKISSKTVNRNYSQ